MLSETTFTISKQCPMDTSMVRFTFRLPSRFQGLGGNNPDGFADDEYEDSCSDGIDNDGDLLLDSDTTVRPLGWDQELSLYRYTAYKFGFGLDSGEFTLDDTSYQGTANLSI